MVLRAIVVHALLIVAISSIAGWVVSCGSPAPKVDLEDAVQGQQLYPIAVLDKNLKQHVSTLALIGIIGLVVYELAVQKGADDMV